VFDVCAVCFMGCVVFDVCAVCFMVCALWCVPYAMGCVVKAAVCFRSMTKLEINEKNITINRMIIITNSEHCVVNQSMPILSGGHSSSDVVKTLLSCALQR